MADEMIPGIPETQEQRASRERKELNDQIEREVAEEQRLASEKQWEGLLGPDWRAIMAKKGVEMLRERFGEHYAPIAAASRLGHTYDETNIDHSVAAIEEIAGLLLPVPVYVAIVLKRGAKTPFALITRKSGPTWRFPEEAARGKDQAFDTIIRLESTLYNLGLHSEEVSYRLRLGPKMTYPQASGQDGLTPPRLYIVGVCLAKNHIVEDEDKRFLDLDALLQEGKERDLIPSPLFYMIQSCILHIREVFSAERRTRRRERDRLHRLVTAGTKAKPA